RQAGAAASWHAGRSSLHRLCLAGGDQSHDRGEVPMIHSRRDFLLALDGLGGRRRGRARRDRGPPEVIAIRRAAFITAAVELLFLVGCARSPAPEDVAVEYGRAMYRYDAAAIYRLASATDRRAKDEETVRAQVGGPSGFALDIIRHLALFIEAKPVDTRLWE